MNMTVSGIDLRIAQGAKGPADLRADLFVNGRWVPVRMELVFALADFFAENERVLAQERTWWRYNGDTYFVRELRSAIQDGWQVPAQKLDRDRAKRGAA